MKKILYLFVFALIMASCYKTRMKPEKKPYATATFNHEHDKDTFYYYTFIQYK